MKSKKVFIYILLIISITLFTNCIAPSIQLYEGPERPDSEIVILKHKNRGFVSGRIYSIDGNEIVAANEYRLLPGEHNIMAASGRGGINHISTPMGDYNVLYGTKRAVHYIFSSYVFKAGYEYVIKNEEYGDITEPWIRPLSKINYRLGIGIAQQENWWDHSVEPEILGVLRLPQFSWTPFLWDVFHGNLEKVKSELAVNPELLQKKFTFHRQHKESELEYEITLLHLSVMARNAEMTTFLLKKGMGVSRKMTERDYTPLHMFAIESFNKSLDLGDEKLTTDEILSGTTMAHKRSIKTLNILLEHGAHIDVKDKYGWTPLLLASEFNVFNAVTALVEKGADINFKLNDNKWTPLHIAARWGHLQIIKYLVENGADPNAKTADGQTPLEVARKINSVLWYLSNLDKENK